MIFLQVNRIRPHKWMDEFSPAGVCVKTSSVDCPTRLDEDIFIVVFLKIGTLAAPFADYYIEFTLSL